MRFAILLCFIISTSFLRLPSLHAQDLPFSERFFPNSPDSLKNAQIELQNGDDYFYSGNTAIYKFAIQHYESANKFNHYNASLNYKLGVCYLMAHQKDLALTHLQKAIELNPEVESEAYYYLGLTYQMMLRWDEAITQYFHYGELVKGTEPVGNVNRRIEECRNGKEILMKPVRVKIENLGATINSKGPEYTPLITADESALFFTSRRPGSTGDETDIDDLEYYEDIYTSEKINGQWTVAKNLGPTVNTPLHDAGAGLSTDGQILFVFKGGRNNGDILISNKNKGDWSIPVDPGKYINTKYHESSACLSPDKSTLYFSSDRPGGYGGRDLYNSQWDSTKKIWGPAVNMGKVVNSEYDEEGVYMHPIGNTLYFSSKGHTSMGGYDVFYSTLLNGNWQKPLNVGYPVNTPDDDVYFVISANSDHAYYATVKDDTFGETDLYRITYLAEADKPISRMMVLKGMITDATTDLPMAATIEIVDLNKQEHIGNYSSDSKTGKYLISLPAGKKYGAFVYSKGYLFESTYFDVADSITYVENIYDVALKPMETGSDVVLTNIFFDSGSPEIKKESEPVLKDLAKIMTDNPTLTIEISGHTDNEGDDKLNLKLSENRAKNVVEFMIAQGISKERLSYKGYGETKPLFPNNTPENRMKNRRIEFKVNSK